MDLTTNFVQNDTFATVIDGFCDDFTNALKTRYQDASEHPFRKRIYLKHGELLFGMSGESGAEFKVDLLDSERNA